ncbi:uncharacterized protein FN964_002008 isoform 1-T1 [Alca torda]
MRGPRSLGRAGRRKGEPARPGEGAGRLAGGQVWQGRGSRRGDLPPQRVRCILSAQLAASPLRPSQRLLGPDLRASRTTAPAASLAPEPGWLMHCKLSNGIDVLRVKGEMLPLETEAAKISRTAFMREIHSVFTEISKIQ